MRLMRICSRAGVKCCTAAILRDHFADTAATEPELLAHHFTQGGLTEVAIE
jgi:hypothetical protein